MSSCERYALLWERNLCSGSELVLRSAAEAFLDLSPLLDAPVLVTNHPVNLQVDRLYEPKRGVFCVEGVRAFSGFDLGSDALQRYSASFHQERRDQFNRRTLRARRWIRRRRLRLDEPLPGPARRVLRSVRGSRD